jgi:MFS family permease
LPEPATPTQRLARRLPFFYGWLIVAIVFVTMALGVNARTAFSLLMPPILAEFGWDRAVTAGAFSFGFFVTGLMSPALGRLMDARGPRFVMPLGVAATGAGLLLAAVAHQPWHLYLTLGVLVGAGSSFLGYTGQALFLPNWFARRRGLAIGIAYAGVGVGSIVMFPWFQALIEHAGWRSACVTLGVVVLVVAGPLNLLLRRRPEDLGLRPDGDAAPAAGTTARAPLRVVDPAWAAVDWTLARAMRTARFWWVGLALFCGLYAWYAVQVHQTQVLREAGFSAAQAAWALGAVSLFGIPGQIALGALSDRVGREVVWTIGSLGFIVTYAALLMLVSLGPHPALLWVIVVAQGLLGYGVTPVFGAIPAEIFQGRHFGSIFGVLMLGGFAGGALGPWVMGALHDATGSYGPAFATGIAASALGIVAVWLAAPRKVRAVAGIKAQSGQIP